MFVHNITFIIIKVYVSPIAEPFVVKSIKEESFVIIAGFRSSTQAKTSQSSVFSSTEIEARINPMQATATYTKYNIYMVLRSVISHTLDNLKGEMEGLISVLNML